MSFLLPVTTTIVLLGYTFDLRDYSFKAARVYEDDEIKSLTQITEINDFKAEYKLIESQIDYRKFLGVDAATNLKVLIDEYYYTFRYELRHDVEGPNSNNVQLALKLSLRTVNETVPFDAPQLADWELSNSRLIGNNYVKSIIYGSDVFLLLNIQSQNPEHKAAITRSMVSKLGKSGTFDQSFKEKINEILQEHNTWYMTNSFGTVPYYADNVPADNVDRMLALKETLSEVMKTVNDGKGSRLFYELQPVSLLSSNFPLIEISSDIFNKLDEVERKYEDLRVADEEFNSWVNNLPELTEEEEIEVSEIYKELQNAKSNMTIAIARMDISTLGNINQFSAALQAYGSTVDDHKYRKNVDLLRQRYPN